MYAMYSILSLPFHALLNLSRTNGTFLVTSTLGGGVLTHELTVKHEV